jgi:hypothetical protein
VGPEWVALLGVATTIAVKVLSDRRAKVLERELEAARDRELSLERDLHTARCQLARHGLSDACPTAGGSCDQRALEADE